MTLRGRGVRDGHCETIIGMPMQKPAAGMKSSAEMKTSAASARSIGRSDKIPKRQLTAGRELSRPRPHSAATHDETHPVHMMNTAIAVVDALHPKGVLKHSCISRERL